VRHGAGSVRAPQRRHGARDSNGDGRRRVPRPLTWAACCLPAGYAPSLARRRAAAACRRLPPHASTPPPGPPAPAGTIPSTRAPADTLGALPSTWRRGPTCRRRTPPSAAAALPVRASTNTGSTTHLPQHQAHRARLTNTSPSLRMGARPDHAQRACARARVETHPRTRMGARMHACSHALVVACARHAAHIPAPRHLPRRRPAVECRPAIVHNAPGPWAPIELPREDVCVPGIEASAGPRPPAALALERPSNRPHAPGHGACARRRRAACPSLLPSCTRGLCDVALPPHSHPPAPIHPGGGQNHRHVPMLWERAVVRAHEVLRPPAGAAGLGDACVAVPPLPPRPPQPTPPTPPLLQVLREARAAPGPVQLRLRGGEWCGLYALTLPVRPPRLRFDPLSHTHTRTHHRTHPTPTITRALPQLVNGGDTGKGIIGINFRWGWGARAARVCAPDRQ
jgi:hypothetical protein